MSILIQFRDKYLHKGGFFRNFSVLVLCNILVNIINLFVNMYLARTLQPAIYGQYGVIISWATILQMFASLGIQQVTIRSIAQNPTRSSFYFKVSLLSRYAGYIATALIFFIYSRIFKDFNIFTITLILSNVFVLLSWDSIQNLAFGMQRMEYTGYINVVCAFITLLVYIILPKSAITLYNVIIIVITLTAIKDIIYYITCKKQGLLIGGAAQKINKEDIIGLIKESQPFYILAIFSAFTNHFPVLFLNHNSGSTEVAFFNTANKLMVPLSMAINTIMTALFPNLARDALYGSERLIEKVKKCILFVVLFGSYMCLSIALFRNEIVTLLYGESYSQTGDVMLYQCWFIVFNALFSIFGTVWAALKRDRLLATISIVYAMVNFPILWISSQYGATVMSYGYIIGCIINMTYHYYFFCKELKFKLSHTFNLSITIILVTGLLFSAALGLVHNIIFRTMIWIVITIVWGATIKKLFVRI